MFVPPDYHITTTMLGAVKSMVKSTVHTKPTNYPVHTQLRETPAIRKWRKRMGKSKKDTHIIPKDTIFAWCKADRKRKRNGNKKKNNKKRFILDVLSTKKIPDRLEEAMEIAGGVEIVVPKGKKSKKKPFDAQLVLRPAFKSLSRRNVQAKMYEHVDGETFLEVVGDENGCKYSLHCFLGD